MGLDVICGGGKTLCAIIPNLRLIASPDVPIDTGIIVTPRKSLVKQFEGDFADPRFKAYFNHNIKFIAATNSLDPMRGGEYQGYITTYQAVGRDFSRKNLRSLSRRNFILVLDEFHHLVDDEAKAWYRQIAQLQERAALTVLMSGTFGRNDNNRLPFLDDCYIEVGRNKYQLQYRDSDERVFIHYGLREAMRDQAIIHVDFYHHNSKVEWMNLQGDYYEWDSTADIPEGDNANAIFTILEGNAAYDILESCLEDWVAHKKENPNAKMLVIAPRQNLARAWQNWLKDRGFNFGLAISDEGVAAQNAIDRFKLLNGSSGQLDGLITCQMAYEGLNVPSITNVALLTHIRSHFWLMQAVLRAGRFDDLSTLGYLLQRGKIFGPDEPRYNRFASNYLREQAQIVWEKEGGPPPPPPRWEPILPMSSEVIQVRMTSPTENLHTDYDEHQIFKDYIQEKGLEGKVSPAHAKALLGEDWAKSRQAPSEDEIEKKRRGRQKTESELIKIESKKFSDECRRVDGIMMSKLGEGKWEWGWTHRIVYREMNARTHTVKNMSLKEIQHARRVLFQIQQGIIDGVITP